MVRSRTQRAVRALSGRLLSRAVMALTLAGVMVAQAAWSPGSAAAVGDSEAGENAPVQEADGEAPGADVAVPTVTGPVTGGTRGMPFNGLSEEFLQQHGYVEEEFFVEGEATAYAPEGELGEDGRWTVTEESTAPYTTRILVHRPVDAADFDGSVFVEWFNVSAGRDSDPDIGWAHEELLQSGSVFVGVSAQKVGVEGGGFTLPTPGALEAPKLWDPERYAPISHPGDQYSYDIFSQAAQALRRPGEVDPMGGLTPETIIGMGQSQSAARMAAYVNAVQPVAGIYDGLVVHSRGAGAAPLGTTGSPVGDGVARLRDDLDVPVLQLQTEAEVGGGFPEARQDDTDMIRTWEVAGTAHVDYGQVEYGEVLADRDRAAGANAMLTACPSMNQAPLGEVLSAGLAGMRRWAAGGEPLSQAEPIQFENGEIVRDERGNALGGVRTPALDAPIAAHAGLGSATGGNFICAVFGESVPFDPETLAELYPTHEDYVAAVTEAADAAAEAGFLLRVDADAMIAEAEAANVPPVESPVPTPEVTAAPDAGEPFNAAPVDLAAQGVREDEYLFSGTTSQGDYTSRMIVRSPADPERFNGTVIVEQLNPVAGFDLDVDFQSLLPLVASEGYAYVGVTAQTPAVEFLREQNPERYGSLAMADQLNSSLLGPQPASYEVFSQAGMALQADGTGEDPLGGLQAERLIAVGQAQSAARLTTFVDRVHGVTLEPVYDAFLPHAGGGAPARFPAPILKLNSENEAPNYFGSRDTTDPNYRYWEVPGAAQAPIAGTEDAIGLVRSVLDLGEDEFPACPFPFQGPGGPVPIDPVLRAAVVHLDQWVQTGEAPPTAPLIEMTPSAWDENAGEIQRDLLGNARGGIRMPQQVVPTGRNSPSHACGFTTLPQWDAFDGARDPGFDLTDTWWFLEPANPQALYGSHDGYVERFTDATTAAQDAGFVLPADAQQLVDEAEASDIAR